MAEGPEKQVQDDLLIARALKGDQKAYESLLVRANCAIDFVRKKRIEALSLDRPIQTKDGQVEFELPDRTWDPERNLVRKQKLKSIDEAIDSLPDKYREVIIYRHKDDKSYEEIADILGTPVGTVKARIFRARELLKKKLKSIR